VWLDAASDGDAGSGSDGGDTGDATNGGTCPPAGLVETFDTLAHASAAITGRWQVCTGEQNLAQFAPADSVGLEFGPASSGGGVCPQWSPTAPCLGGALYFLVAGPTGLTRGAGRMYQYEYGLMGDPTSDPQLEFVSAWGGSWGTTFRYSPAPRELDVASFGYQGGATMVSIP
jgi:hypothetical protein